MLENERKNFQRNPLETMIPFFLLLLEPFRNKQTFQYEIAQLFNDNVCKEEKKNCLFNFIYCLIQGTIFSCLLCNNEH